MTSRRHSANACFFCNRSDVDWIIWRPSENSSRKGIENWLTHREQTWNWLKIEILKSLMGRRLAYQLGLLDFHSIFIAIHLIIQAFLLLQQSDSRLSTLDSHNRSGSGAPIQRRLIFILWPFLTVTRANFPPRADLFGEFISLSTSDPGWSANVFVYVLKLLKISIFLSTQVSARMRKVPCRTKAATSHEERFFHIICFGALPKWWNGAKVLHRAASKHSSGEEKIADRLCFFIIMFMTLKLVLHASLKRSFRLGLRQENGTPCAGATRTLEKRSWQSTKRRKSFSVSFATSLKLCNRNRDQKYVKIKRAAKIGLSREKKFQKKKTTSFFKIPLQTFKLCVFEFEICVV